MGAEIFEPNMEVFFIAIPSTFCRYVSFIVLRATTRVMPELITLSSSIGDRLAAEALG